MDAGGWELTLRDADGSKRIGKFDVLVAASGTYWDQKIPAWNGQFDGKIIHAQDYRSPDALDVGGKDVIVVGIGIAILEIAGNVIIKPFALCVRLLANMMAGHMVLGSIVIISVTAFHNGSYAGSAVAFLGSLAIFFLELFVAFLQAYIFMFLTAIFISLGLPHEHDHEHEGHDAHGHELVDGPHGMNPPKGQELPVST